MFTRRWKGRSKAEVSVKMAALARTQAQKMSPKQRKDRALLMVAGRKAKRDAMSV